MIPGIEVCRVSSKDSVSEMSFIEEMQRRFPDIRFESCASDYDRASTGADITSCHSSTGEDSVKFSFSGNASTWVSFAGSSSADAAKLTPGKYCPSIRITISPAISLFIFFSLFHRQATLYSRYQIPVFDFMAYTSPGREHSS